MRVSRQFAHGTESGALMRRMREVQESVAPGSRKIDRLRGELRRAAIQDNEDKLYRGAGEMVGTDRFGKALAPPAKSTLARWNRKGLIRQILAPHGLGSRTITCFRAVWVFDGRLWRLIMGWRGIPWMQYHLEGRPRGSHPLHPNWSLPKRDIGGQSPAGWVVWRKSFADFMRRVVKERA